jgi:hypothetical protein
VLYFPFAVIASIVAILLFRNVWLFNRLLKLSDEEASSIELTYYGMFVRVWVWNVRKFLPAGKAGTY